jgi:hypothetical protein
MEVNCNKSVFLCQNIDSSTKQLIYADFNIKFINLEEGMKYLDFSLKPNGYRVEDWKWLLEKISKRISNWTFQWLSLGGRLVLVKAVLQSIHVYWLSLAKVPTSILNKIQHLMANFIWKGAYKTIGFHLTKWQNIAIPKEFGGWGIRDIFWIAKSLAAKYCWRGLFGNNIWSQILKRKYLKGIDLTSWIHRGIHKSTMGSTIWKHFLCSLPLIKQWLAWQIGSGNQVVIGKDPFIGDSTYYKLSDPLIYSLNTQTFFPLHKQPFLLLPTHLLFGKVPVI